MTLEPKSEEERDRRSRHAAPPLPRETPDLVTATQVFNLTQLIDSEREEPGCDLNTFTIYWVLKQVGVAEARATALTLEDAFRRFPNHGHNADERRRLKAEPYKVLLPAVGKERMVGLVERLLALVRKENGV